MNKMRIRNEIILKPLYGSFLEEFHHLQSKQPSNVIKLEVPKVYQNKKFVIHQISIILTLTSVKIWIEPE